MIEVRRSFYLRRSRFGKKLKIILIIVQLALFAFLVINNNLLLKDILLLCLFFFLVNLIIGSTIWIFKKGKKYVAFLYDFLYTALIGQTIIFVFIVFLTTPRYITKKDAIVDLDMLVAKCENVHPDLYYHIPKESFSKILNKVKNNLPDKISELQFTKVCFQLCSHFKDGHTKPLLNLLEKRNQWFFKCSFPYKINVIDNRLYISDSFVPVGGIPLGSEIIEINGKTANEFISEMETLLSYESDTWRNTLLSDPNKIAMWNDFNSYKLKYKKKGSDKILETTAAGGIISKIISKGRYRDKRSAQLVYKVLPDNIGYIGFYDCHDLSGYKQFFSSTFADINRKSIDDLIIDVRKNGGGYSIIGLDLMKYIFHQPFQEFDSLTFKVSNELIETKKLDYYLNSEKQVIGNMYTIIPDYLSPYDKPLRFSGNTYLLTDKGTFSAATIFVSTFKCFGNGKIIGEPTGGLSVTFGDVYGFTLPNSNIKMWTSWKKFYQACGIDNGLGVIPDYVVKNSPTDEIGGQDKVLEYTLDLIKNSG